MNTAILDILAVEAALVPKVLLELAVDVVGNWFPAVLSTRDQEGKQEVMRQNPPSSIHPHKILNFYSPNLNHRRAFKTAEMQLLAPAELKV